MRSEAQSVEPSTARAKPDRGVGLSGSGWRRLEVAAPVISGLGCAAVIVRAAWGQREESVPVHWGADGVANGWMPLSEALAWAGSVSVFGALCALMLLRVHRNWLVRLSEALFGMLTWSGTKMMFSSWTRVADGNEVVGLIVFVPMWVWLAHIVVLVLLRRLVSSRHQIAGSSS